MTPRIPLCIRPTLLVLPLLFGGCSVLNHPDPAMPRFEPPVTSAAELPATPAVPGGLVSAPERLGLGVPQRNTVYPRGGVRALVVPLGTGHRLPAWSDTTIAYDVIGAPGLAGMGRPLGVAGRLSTWSGGTFRLDASVLPPLIAANLDEAALLHSSATGRDSLTALARRAVVHWARQINLASFDNDGPDGHPMSGDDDGTIDLLIFTLESASNPSILRIPLDLTLPAGRDGSIPLRVDEGILITLPASGTVSPANLGATTAVLTKMGLQVEEMFFPQGYPREISTLALVRLGWLPVAWTPTSGTYSVPDSTTLALPLVDVDGNRGLWIVERHGSVAYLTRIARKADGHFGTVSVQMMVPDPDEDVFIPLSARDGQADGPNATLSWPSIDAPLSVRVVLQPRG